MPPVSSEPRPGTTAEAERLLTALEQLPPRPCWLLGRWVLEGEPSGALAQKLGVPEPVLAIALSRAAHRLARVELPARANEAALAGALVSSHADGTAPEPPSLRPVSATLARLGEQAEAIRALRSARATRNASKETWLRWGMVVVLGALALLWR
jgi:hypothetical protein